MLVEVDPAPAGAAAVLARLRAGEPPVVARVERGRVVLDLRTVPRTRTRWWRGRWPRPWDLRPARGSPAPSGP